MNFQNLIQKLSQQYREELPFAVFSFHGSETAYCYLQKDRQLYTSENLSENGFVMAPFDSRLTTVMIPESKSEFLSITIDFIEVDKNRVEVEEKESDREAHYKLVADTISTIKNGNAEKIVVSRKKDFALGHFSVEELIRRLFSAYPTAYRYVWYHPETGVWCGATPEVLVSVRKNAFKTMALAGTQPYHEGEVHWRKKEKDEQHFVTLAILDNLKDFVDDLQVSEVQSIRAGSLYHLKSDIEGVMRDREGILAEIVKIMHPTPAVCGTPQGYSRDFIIENENYPREFYTGYVGPIEDNGTSAALMVNLRCMKIKDEVATIMVGGGVTIDSDVEEEWIETRNKMQTMLQVLQPML